MRANPPLFIGDVMMLPSRRRTYYGFMVVSAALLCSLPKRDNRWSSGPTQLAILADCSDARTPDEYFTSTPVRQVWRSPGIHERRWAMTHVDIRRCCSRA